MSSILRKLGAFGTFAGQIIFVLAALATIIPAVTSYLSPSTRLVADIYPMEFRLPVNLDEIAAATRTNQPMSPALAHLLATSGANGFARIDLRNDGELPIEDIHIRVFGATVYARGTPNMNDSSVISSDASGIKMPT